MDKAIAFDAAGFRGGKVPPGFRTLVLGSEFCAGLLPAPAEAAAVNSAFGGKIALATPLLTDDGLDKVRALLRLYARSGRELEVIANDLGLLEVLRSAAKGRFTVSCGRLLANRIKIMPEAFARDFIARYRLSRFEVDDPSIMKRLKPYGLGFSWHYPLRYATLTRFCPWENRWAYACARSCAGKTMPLRSPRVPETLWLAACAYFTKGQGPRKSAERNVFDPPPAEVAALADRRKA